LDEAQDAPRVRRGARTLSWGRKETYLLIEGSSRQRRKRDKDKTQATKVKTALRGESKESMLSEPKDEDDDVYYLKKDESDKAEQRRGNTSKK